MTQYFKKIAIVSAILGMGCLIFSTNIAFADDSLPFYDASQPVQNEDNLNIAGNLTQNELTPDDSTFARIRDFFGMGIYAGKGQNAPALAYVKMVVNRLLGLVSLISLIMIIIAFYMIFFSKQEEAVGKAKKMLIGVAIALAVMGLSRYIVSYFYNIYSTATGAI